MAAELGWAGWEAAQDWLIGAVGSLGPRRGDPGAVRHQAGNHHSPGVAGVREHNRRGLDLESEYAGGFLRLRGKPRHGEAQRAYERKQYLAGSNACAFAYLRRFN